MIEAKRVPTIFEAIAKHLNTEPESFVADDSEVPKAKPRQAEATKGAAVYAEPSLNVKYRGTDNFPINPRPRK